MDYEDVQPGIPHPSNQGGQPSRDGAHSLGHEGTNESAQTRGHEGPNESAQTSGPSGPDLRAHSSGPEGGRPDYEKKEGQDSRHPADGYSRPTRIIAVGNQKGGVAKSSMALNTALELVGQGTTPGKKCLIIDLDANAGMTRSLGIPTTWMGSFEMMLGEDDPEQLILKNDPDEGIILPESVHVLPASRDLENLDRAFRDRRENKFTDPTDSLKKPMESLVGKYDYIVMDTGPNAGTPTIAAYKTAQYFLLSTTPDKLSYDALVDALTDILAVRDTANPDLRLLGVVLSMVDRRTTLADRYIGKIQNDFGKVGQNGAFETTISRAIVVPKSNEVGLPVSLFDPKHKINDQFRALAREIEQRIDAFEGEGYEENHGDEPVVELTPQAPVVGQENSNQQGVVNG